MSFKWLLIAALVACSSKLGCTRRRKISTNQRINNGTSFDFLVLAQSWPLTECFLWEEKSPKNQCSLPHDDEWTIHGLWPTRHQSIGPKFCKHTERFNASKIDSLKPQMETKWRDLHKRTKPETFWKYEWKKHGTCASEILDSQHEYFSKGLELYDSYNMKTVLIRANIMPNQKYSFQDYLDGVGKVLGKNSQTLCALDNRTGLSYVAEMRICFNKNFTLIDCKSHTNCPAENVVYPAKPPSAGQRLGHDRVWGQ